MRSIKSRLILSILVITIIPVIAFLIYSLVFVSDDQIQSNINKNETKILWATQYLDSRIAQLEDLIYSIHIEEGLLEDIDHMYFSPSTEIEGILRDVLYSNANIASEIAIISNNTKRIVAIDYENGYTVNSLTTINKYEEYQGVPTGIRFIKDEDSIKVIHTINDFQTQEELGVIIIQLNHKLVDDFDVIFGSELNYILMSSNEVVYASQDQISEDLLETLSIDHTNQTLRSYVTSDQYVWSSRILNEDVYLVSMIDASLINAFNSRLITTGLLIIMISLAVTIPTSILLSNRITKPIIQLVNHMNDFEFSHVKNELQNYDEINLLERSYNKMIDEMKVMIQERYKNRIDIQSAQLKALQAQINPHFLSNTFQLIGGMALNANAEEIYDATIKMSNIVRYSMKLNQESTTLEEELLHLENYLSIQKLRYGDHLTFEINVSKKMKNIQIPKLSIQPIIENSFRHGLRHKEGQWNISITGSIKDHLIITLKDNGVGIDLETLEKINQQFIERENHLKIADEEYFSGIGLVNIDSRIKLLYGEQYGLHLESSKNHGTTTTITLPKEMTKR